MPIRISRNGRAATLNAAGNDCEERGDTAAARDLYAQAARAQPNWAVPWFNLGLVHKYAGEWQASLEANLAALEREPDHDGAVWNAGIAATALGQWRLARAMWRRFGIDMADSDEPSAFAPALTPIRVDPNGLAPEVIWADRIDPARAVIRSVPTAASGRRYGDLLLHDGAPNGWRRLDGREVPVFDELAVLTASDYETWELHITQIDADQTEALLRQLSAADLPAEDWGGLRNLCRACSEGRPDDDAGHDHGPLEPASADTVRIGLAMPASAADPAWVRVRVADIPGAALHGLTRVLPAEALEARP